MQYEPEDEPVTDAMYAEGFHAGREYAGLASVEEMRTLPLDAANPTMGRALWLNDMIEQLAREAPEEVRADVVRFRDALGRCWIAAAQTDRAQIATDRTLGRHFAVAQSVGDQIAAFAREEGAGPSGAADISDDEALAYARGFLDAVAERLGW